MNEHSRNRCGTFRIFIFYTGFKIKFFHKQRDGSFLGYIKSYVETSDKTLRRQWPCALTSSGLSNTDTDLPRVKRVLTRNRGNENHSINSWEPRRYTLSQSESIQEVSFASGRGIWWEENEQREVPNSFSTGELQKLQSFRRHQMEATSTWMC